MKILLIEDDQFHCNEYEKCVEYLPYTVNLSVSNSGTKGIELTKSIQPDIILLDLELHKSDMDGLLFLNELKNLNLKSIPYIIVITHNTSQKTYEIARHCGADYIFPKSKPDYSPRLVYEFAYNYFINQPKKYIPSIDDVNLKDKVNYEMDKIGITNGMGGRNYIIEAVQLILNLYPNDANASNINLVKNVYPVVAKKYKKSAGSIEQGIKNAIQKAWLITDIEVLSQNYTATVSYRTGYPNNKDFIFYYVDKLKDI